MVKHQHAGGNYNQRRIDCEKAVDLLAKHNPDIRALRDVSPERLFQNRDTLPPEIYKRCLHVVNENSRVLAGAACLRHGNLEHFGELMLQSHESLRDLYEVSCRELDIMVDVAENIPGFYGGRMTGGGFGGCTLNLVQATGVSEFVPQVAERYQSITGIKPQIYVCSAEDGARMELAPIT